MQQKTIPVEKCSGDLDSLSDAELERMMDTSFNIPTEEKKQKVCLHLKLKMLILIVPVGF